MKVRIRLIDGGKLPVFKHDGDACADCHARITGGSISIPAGTRVLVNLGFALELPDGYEAVIRPRSGLTACGVDCGIGTIDSGYRGEVKACVINNSGSPFVIDDGDRICQLAIREAPKIEFEVAETLSGSERSEAGFGSTGVK